MYGRNIMNCEIPRDIINTDGVGYQRKQICMIKRMVKENFNSIRNIYALDSIIFDCHKQCLSKETINWMDIYYVITFFLSVFFILR